MTSAADPDELEAAIRLVAAELERRAARAHDETAVWARNLAIRHAAASINENPLPLSRRRLEELHQAGISLEDLESIGPVGRRAAERLRRYAPARRQAASGPFVARAASVAGATLDAFSSLSDDEKALLAVALVARLDVRGQRRREEKARDTLRDAARALAAASDPDGIVTAIRKIALAFEQWDAARITAAEGNRVRPPRRGRESRPPALELLVQRLAASLTRSEPSARNRARQVRARMEKLVESLEARLPELGLDIDATTIRAAVPTEEVIRHLLRDIRPGRK